MIIDDIIITYELMINHLLNDHNIILNVYYYKYRCFVRRLNQGINPLWIEFDSFLDIDLSSIVFNDEINLSDLS